MENIHVGSWMYVKPSDIKLLRASINYTYIQFFSGKEVIVSTTIKRIHEQLPPKKFIRPNRKEIVNLSFIDKYTASKKEDTIILQDNTVIKVSRRRRDDIRIQFGLMHKPRSHK